MRLDPNQFKAEVREEVSLRNPDRLPMVAGLYAELSVAAKQVAVANDHSGEALIPEHWSRLFKEISVRANKAPEKAAGQMTKKALLEEMKAAQDKAAQSSPAIEFSYGAIFAFLGYRDITDNLSGEVVAIRNYLTPAAASTETAAMALQQARNTIIFAFGGADQVDMMAASLDNPRGLNPEVRMALPLGRPARDMYAQPPETKLAA